MNTSNNLIAVVVKELELENFGGRMGSLTGETGKSWREKVFGRKTRSAFDVVSLMWQRDNPWVVHSRKYALGF